jgi:hypothetical protein
MPSGRVNAGRERRGIAKISRISRQILHFGGLGISHSRKVFLTIFCAARSPDLPGLRQSIYLDALSAWGYSSSMASSAEFHHGVVHGKLIELDSAIGLPDGQEVQVIVQPVRQKKRLAPGEGIRRSAGGWSDDPVGLDAFLEWNRQQRKLDRPEIEP